MYLDLILGLFLTVLPIFELRGGLPLIVKYCTETGVSVWPYFILVVFLNSIISLFVFIFLDHGHNYFLRWNFYKKYMNKYIERVRKKAIPLELKIKDWGFVILSIFVAIPLPGTGAWTGAVLAWILKLDRTKSIIAIFFGVLIAGLIMLGVSFGFFSLF